MKFSTIVFILAILPFICSAQHSDVRPLENFVNIDFEGYGELVLIQGENPSIEIKTDGHRRSLRHVNTEVKNGTLYIDQDYDDRYDWYQFRKNDVFITLYITYSHLESLELEGKINVISDKSIHANRLEMDFEGYITGDLEFDCKELIIESSGFAHIDLFGKTDFLEIDHQGIGRIDALDLQSISCVANVEGRASLYVNATGELEAESNGFSKILYRGRPDKIDIDRSTFSKVKRYH